MSKKQVLSKLLSDHIGSENAISHGQLSEALGLSKSSVADIVQELRDDTDYPPLGTNKGGNSGTYVIADKAELQEQVSVWNAEKQRVVDRIEKTIASYENNDTEFNATIYECAKCGCEATEEGKKYPKGGEFEGELLCKSCYGTLLMNGEV